jgi:hypothetical protein
MTMNHRYPLVSTLLLSLAFGACSSAPPYAALAIEDDAEATSNVTITDAELHDVVRVGQPFVERVAGTNQLHIAVPIRNIDDETIQILAQVSFLNGRKQPIGDDTNRQVQILGPGETMTFVATSKQAEAADWQLRIGWNR